MKLEGGKMGESVAMSTAEDGAILRVENVRMSGSYNRLGVAVCSD
jgi:hypothetical protein